MYSKEEIYCVDGGMLDVKDANKLLQNLQENSILCVPNEVNGIKVTFISPFAFSNLGCKIDLHISEGVEEIGAYAFSKNKFINITFPKSLKKIGDLAFSECEINTVINFKNLINLEEIGLIAFDNSKTIIADQTFIPKSVKEIREYALDDITLKELCFENPQGWYYLDYDERAILIEFSNDYQKNYNVYKKHADKLLGRDDVICFECKGDTILALKEKFKALKPESIIIPDTINEGVITKIAPNAFCGNETIKKVLISKGIKQIGEKAFYGCLNLQKVEFEDKNNWVVSLGFDKGNTTNVDLSNCEQNAKTFKDKGNFVLIKK